jgi:DNA-binding MarR family transcriptional regulator
VPYSSGNRRREYLALVRTLYRAGETDRHGGVAVATVAREADVTREAASMMLRSLCTDGHLRRVRGYDEQSRQWRPSYIPETEQTTLSETAEDHTETDQNEP